jgi:large subunit ribosomal protein L9
VLHPEVSVLITANVAQSTEEAEMQAKGIDPLRLRDEEETRAELIVTESPSGRREEGRTRAG